MTAHQATHLLHLTLSINSSSALSHDISSLQASQVVLNSVCPVLPRYSSSLSFLRKQCNTSCPLQYSINLSPLSFLCHFCHLTTQIFKSLHSHSCQCLIFCHVNCQM